MSVRNISAVVGTCAYCNTETQAPSVEDLPGTYLSAIELSVRSSRAGAEHQYLCSATCLSGFVVTLAQRACIRGWDDSGNGHEHSGQDS